ncbi:MAG TPA: NAD(P)/FAD-dependent oxidoreductase [Nocardioidaceae bacterium]|nr:NAD(P)/FAD-dependent oxidoreductase [Nocardioidaceae bacterium]
MNSTYDVVVVGARVAGASTALLLARAGLKVALVDRAAYGSDTMSTHALMRAGVLQLSRWGVLPEVVAANTPAVEKVLFHYADEDTVQVSIRPTPGVEALYAPRRYLVDRILVDAAAAAGVDVRHGVTVTGLLDSGRGRVAGVRATTRDGASFDLRAGFTVGADGLRSVVADQVGAPVERWSDALGASLYRYHSDFCVAGYEWCYGPTSSAGMIPTNDGLTCVFVAAGPERIRSLRRRGADAAFETLFAEAAPEHLPRLHMSTPASRMHGWSGAPGFVRRSWGPGWALVGDAGYFKDPITAHGMTDAMRDAELLADAILQATAGLCPEEQALSAYQRQRDLLSRRLFEATDKIAAYNWDMDRIRRLLREVSSAMVDEVEALERLPLRHVSAGLARNIPPDRVLAPE